ncbi:MAG: hypothetical protein NTV14_01120 [Coprothermobacterota bacterium]|nr:hypothetical protein [Coprothermobacterota bacterium]
MKVVVALLLVALLAGTAAAYGLLLFPVESAWADGGDAFPILLTSLRWQSFLLARLPASADLIRQDPRLSEARLERYYPFTLGATFRHFTVVWRVREGSQGWEFLSSGNLVPATGEATISATFLAKPLSSAVSSFLLAFAAVLDEPTRKDVVGLEVAAEGRVIVRLQDGTQLFFLAEEAIYRRHLPQLGLYLGKARQGGMKELHFEFNDFFAKKEGDT